MTTALIIVVTSCALGFLYLWRSGIGRTFLKYRGTRLVSCPETNTWAAVQVEAVRAAFELDHVAPEHIPHVLDTNAPLCWDCHDRRDVSPRPS